MRRPMLLFLLLSACVGPPAIVWPEGPAPATPALLPSETLTPPQASADPGPALVSRATALRFSFGL